MKTEAYSRSQFPRKRSVLCRGLQSRVRVVLALALLLTLAGCRSNVVVLDNRPAWVEEAEQRLKKEPVFSANQFDTRNSSSLWDRQPAEGGSKKQEAGKRRVPEGKPKASSSTAASRREPSPSPVTQPEGVSWGETKITVQVEE